MKAFSMHSKEKCILVLTLHCNFILEKYRYFPCFVNISFNTGCPGNDLSEREVTRPEPGLDQTLISFQSSVREVGA